MQNSDAKSRRGNAKLCSSLSSRTSERLSAKREQRIGGGSERDPGSNHKTSSWEESRPHSFDVEGDPVEMKIDLEKKPPTGVAYCFEAFIARSTSSAKVVRCADVLANSSRFCLSVAKPLIMAHSAASVRSFSRCVSMSFIPTLKTYLGGSATHSQSPMDTRAER